MSNFLLYLLLYEKFDKFDEREIVIRSRHRLTAHLYSHERVRRVFSIDDTNLSVYINLETQNTYRLTPYAIIKRDNSEQTTKVYGLTESDGQIDFYHTNSGTVYSFNRPKLNKEKTGYDLDEIPRSGDFKIIAYFLVVVKVALNNIDNFIVLGARVCTTINGNICSNYST